MTIKSLRLILTDEAKADLRGIRRHIAKESPKAAKAFTKELTTKLKKLADTGVTGSSRDWVSSGLRGFLIKIGVFISVLLRAK